MKVHCCSASSKISLLNWQIPFEISNVGANAHRHSRVFEWAEMLRIGACKTMEQLQVTSDV